MLQGEGGGGGRARRGVAIRNEVPPHLTTHDSCLRESEQQHARVGAAAPWRAVQASIWLMTAHNTTEYLVQDKKKGLDAQCLDSIDPD